jgi:SAM-dependent methyltransferase
MKILNHDKEIINSRKILVEKELSFIRSNFLSKLIHKFKLPILNIGDFRKSWDILNTVNFFKDNVDKQSKILDVGSWHSEIILSLHKMGYRDLYGIDINPMVKKMPFSSQINYHVENFFNNSFSDKSFDAITAISTIEHGYDEEKYFTEFSRLLKKDGKLVISFDYWKQKIETNGIKMFDLDWKIFSENEVNIMIKNVEKKYDLALIGERNFFSENKVIDCAGKNYTFAWLSFNKI